MIEFTSINLVPLTKVLSWILDSYATACISAYMSNCHLKLSISKTKFPVLSVTLLHVSKCQFHVFRCIGQKRMLFLASLILLYLIKIQQIVPPIPSKVYFPWRRKWKPTPVFLPGESHGQRNWQETVHGVAKSCT